jgi:hypothetical protein
MKVHVIQAGRCKKAESPSRVRSLMHAKIFVEPSRFTGQEGLMAGFMQQVRLLILK